jgi:hypothetical protein
VLVWERPGVFVLGFVERVGGVAERVDERVDGVVERVGGVAERVDERVDGVVERVGGVAGMWVDLTSFAGLVFDFV